MLTWNIPPCIYGCAAGGFDYNRDPIRRCERRLRRPDLRFRNAHRPPPELPTLDLPKFLSGYGGCGGTGKGFSLINPFT